MELTSVNVHDVFVKCKCQLDNPNAVKINGLTADFLFDSKMVRKYTIDIYDLLMQLPDTFKLSESEPKVNIVITCQFFNFIKDRTPDPIEMFYPFLPGQSFCYAYLSNENVHWGEHPNMQELVVLGMASGLMKMVFPQPIWKYLYGSVPHIIVIDEIKTKNQSQLLPLLDTLSEKFVSELSAISDEVSSIDEPEDQYGQTDFDIQSAQNDFDESGDEASE